MLFLLKDGVFKNQASWYLPYYFTAQTIQNLITGFDKNGSIVLSEMPALRFFVLNNLHPCYFTSFKCSGASK